MFTSIAHAQVAPATTGTAAAATPAADASFQWQGMIPIALVFVVMYFFMIRPQQKRMQEQRNMQDALRRGDHVTTTAGLMGTIAKIEDDRTIQLEIADGVKIRVLKSSILEVSSKPHPVRNSKNDEVAPAANEAGEAPKAVEAPKKSSRKKSS